MENRRKAVNMGKEIFCVPPKPDKTLMREMMTRGAMTRKTSQDMAVTCTRPATFRQKMTTVVKRNWQAARKAKDGKW